MYNFSNSKWDPYQLYSILYQKQSSFQFSLRAGDYPNDHPLPSIFTPNIAHRLLSLKIPIGPLNTTSTLPTHHHHHTLSVTHRNNNLLCSTSFPKHTRLSRCHIDHYHLHPQCLAQANPAAQRRPTPRKCPCHASPARTLPNAKHYPQLLTINRPQTTPHIRSPI